jgi:hypothetical protein
MRRKPVGDFRRMLMDNLRRMITKPESQSPALPKDCIAAYFKLSAPNFGTIDEMKEIHRFTGQLAEAIEASKAGVYDGDEFGEGECGLFMYGPDADRLFDVVYPLLSSWKKMRGGRIIKRYGQPGRSETIMIG